MKITIDNLDGAGAADYSCAVSADGPLKIERTLNAPSRCNGLLDLNATTLPAPARRARIVVSSSQSGASLFTGYIATEPERIYAGVASTGTVYRYAFSAVSDEWLLDKQPLPPAGAGLSQAAGALLTSLTNRVDGTRFTTAGVADGNTAGVFAPRQSAAWSENAGQLASATYAAYRVLNGALSLQSAGAVTHNFSDGDGTLQLNALKSSAVKELTNDVTLSGEMEPTAYIAETFAGDGTTAIFQLSEPPFRPTHAGTPPLDDSFNQSALNQRVWQVSDPGGYLKLGAGGLAITGGTGLDGQTALTAIDAVEMAGALVIEAGRVQMNAAGTGILCGLYAGAVASANCFAGYNVRSSGGAAVIVPFVNGVEVGTAFTMQSGHAYTLRIRLHSVEAQRVLQTFYAMTDGTLQSFGGGSIASPMSLVFELQDLGASSNTPATVLYDGAVAASPASCSFAAVNSVQLSGSIGYCRVTQSGSVWISSTLSDGSKVTRLIGAAGEGVDCTVSATGTVTFFTGRIPVAGELVTVLYRGRRRSVARLQDAASVATESVGGVQGTAHWLGHVTIPPARSSIDCEQAALAVLSFSASRDAAIAGRYTAVNPPDIWPGDVLALDRGGEQMRVLVRQIEIADSTAWPEALTYRIAFANDWAEGLGLKLSENVAADALLPDAAASGASNAIANLQQLQIVSATATTLQLDAGIDPPAGGGFEVRRRDWSFGPGVDQDLVLRSPVRNFSILREAQAERYFVRMYDGSTPPVYSRFSSAVFTHVPVG